MFPVRAAIGRLSLHIACALFVSSAASAATFEDGVRERAEADGSVEALVVLSARAPLQLLRSDGDYLQRRQALVDTLRATAEVSQADLRAWFEREGIAYRPYWIVNMLLARLTPAQLDALAARGDVARIAANAPYRVALPPVEKASSELRAPSAIEWGVAKVRAPDVWATGTRGAGVVIGGQDTGIRWTHVAIKGKYRGWDGSVADHNYNWHDAIHGAGNTTCPGDRTVPCDDNSHGTHTIGTMLGDDGGSRQIGVAPDARWIGCRNMNAGVGTPARYNECAQWFLAPTDLNGQNPRVDLAPDVISNSWGCDADEGCTGGQEVREAIDTLVAGGIFFVAAAGNGGSGCGGIDAPPAIYDSAFVVGATDSGDRLASYSLRGPVAGTTRFRPDASAPGSSVTSAVITSDTAYGSKSGTSMATPHVAGIAALLMSVDPSLKGDPARVGEILRSTAVTQGIQNTSGVTQSCGGTPITTWPNYMAGYGRVDAFAAFRVAETILKTSFD